MEQFLLVIAAFWMASGLMTIYYATMLAGNDVLKKMNHAEQAVLYLKSFFYGLLIKKIMGGTTYVERLELERLRYKKALDSIYLAIIVDELKNPKIKKISEIVKEARNPREK